MIKYMHLLSITLLLHLLYFIMITKHWSARNFENYLKINDVTKLIVLNAKPVFKYLFII